ncbi:MAG: hypothetical protein COT81_03980 [Candidatus Buchananbacteria bacterium CG10_big_fil_rev_8_21_14_0_10_42_9]|uniref:Methyltransferase domain-containing protein n=1 Tax=Candidatus Buchananbacteria bacterium CG10_big_fil_rev_8_21_14_0_10_42_9 TaxID=1974526 RepID=A0A2H0W0L6_9BACT|nr:MAG: hypothetical protein COT81_03980 [Candidatus Buchananbacteria bacterium CG10_big_fil_rev_8_21_14_0_10_42_9]
MKSISELWDTCIQFMWDEEYINGLEEFLKSNSVETVLDPAGGTGFPSIPLKRRGWDITYADSSKLMIEHFEKKLKKAKLNIPHYQIDWEHLPNAINKKFDAVLCRGNSLIYADSWHENNIEKTTLEHIKNSLRAFKAMLNGDGVVYVDIINQKEYDKDYPLIEEFGEREINGKKIKLDWELIHDYDKKIRTWKSIITINGKKSEFVRYSYLLRHIELTDLMNQAGFSGVQEIPIRGEHNYDVFIGYKK